jgi:hypothetical protein
VGRQASRIDQVEHQPSRHACEDSIQPGSSPSLQVQLENCHAQSKIQEGRERSTASCSSHGSGTFYAGCRRFTATPSVTFLHDFVTACRRGSTFMQTKSKRATAAPALPYAGATSSLVSCAFPEGPCPAMAHLPNALAPPDLACLAKGRRRLRPGPGCPTPRHL